MCLPGDSTPFSGAGLRPSQAELKGPRCDLLLSSFHKTQAVVPVTLRHNVLTSGRGKVMAARSLLNGGNHDRLGQWELKPQMETSMVNRVLYSVGGTWVTAGF